MLSAQQNLIHSNNNKQQVQSVPALRIACHLYLHPAWHILTHPAKDTFELRPLQSSNSETTSDRHFGGSFSARSHIFCFSQSTWTEKQPGLDRTDVGFISTQRRNIKGDRNLVAAADPSSPSSPVISWKLHRLKKHGLFLRERLGHIHGWWCVFFGGSMLGAHKLW